MDRVLYSDFDGTIIKQDSERLLVQYLLKKGYFKIWHYFLAAVGLIINTPRRKMAHNNCLRAWSFKLNREKKETLLLEFLQDIEFEYNINVVKMINSFEGKVIVLTGSDKQLVEMIIKRSPIKGKVDSIIGSETFSNGILMREHPYGKDKCKYISRECFSVGIGNEFVDKYYLDICNQAKIVKGDSNLEKVANEKGWQEV